MGARDFWLAAVTLLVGAGSTRAAWGQSVPPNELGEVLTAEASLNLRNVVDLQFSPGGERLAFVVTEPTKGTSRLSHIWIYERRSGGARQFTFSARSESAPRWMPDGKQLAFLSNRAEDQQ